MSNAASTLLPPPVDDERSRVDRVRKELAHVLGVSEEPQARVLRETFARGIAVVRELEKAGKIDSDAVATLQSTMATLYINAMLARFAGDLMGPQLMPPPAFVKWILGAVR